MTQNDLLLALQSSLEAKFTDAEEVILQEGTEFRYATRKFRTFAILLSPALDPQQTPRIGSLVYVYFSANVIVLVKKGKRVGRVTGIGSITERVNAVVNHLRINTLSDLLDPSPISQCGDVEYITTSDDDIAAAGFVFTGFAREALS